MRRIAIDMDGVIADHVDKYLGKFNQQYNKNILLSDLQGRKLWEMFPDLTENIMNYLAEPTFFSDLNVMEYSQEVIKELSDCFEIYVSTGAMEFPTSFTAKYQWLKEHFPFIPDTNIVFCGDKSIIRADFLIDDQIKNFSNFCGKGIIFTAHHNVNETGYDRVNNWKEVREYFVSRYIS